MTTYIPSLTLPSFIFENAAASILLPIVAGTAVGFSTRPKETQKQYLELKQPVRPKPYHYTKVQQHANATRSKSPTSTPSKPPLTLPPRPGRPPAWVFGPAWTLLYGLMGTAAHLAWKTGTTSLLPSDLAYAKHGATLYTLQLGLNLVWMPLFFRFKRPIEATVDVVALTGLTGWLIYVWGQVDERAGWALVPYLGWLGFATYLSAGAGYLNGWDFGGKERRE